MNVVAGYRLRGGYSVGARFHYLRADRRFVFDRFILDVFADFANATLTREVVQLSATQDQATGMPGPVEQASFRLILPTVGVHGEF